MKLLQLNLWGGRLDPQISKLLKAQNPDILCLQEAIDIKGGNAGVFISSEEIQAAIDADYMFMSPAFSFKHMNRVANFGNCIISKYPITLQETIFTGNEYVEDFDFLNQEATMRNVQHAVIDIDGKSIDVLNHHGHHIPAHKNGDAETLRQCQLIAKEIKKLDGPVILAGDFNLAPDSRSLGVINGLLTNLSVKANLKTTRTELTHKTEVCDYILVNSKVHVKSFKALPDVVSDHMALVMEFELV